MRCRCAETDIEVQRCIAAMREAVPDTDECFESNDVAHGPSAEPQTAESVQSSTATRPTSSFAAQQDAVNFDIRNYLIDRCVTDTNTASDAADNGDDVSDGDKVSSAEAVELRRGLCDPAASKPPIFPPAHRYSDSQLAGNGCASTTTFPGRSSSDGRGGAADRREKRHRWKLFRKAFNLFSLDEATVPVKSQDAAGTTDVVHCDDNDDDDGLRRLHGRSTSVESLPGFVTVARSKIFPV